MQRVAGGGAAVGHQRRRARRRSSRGRASAHDGRRASRRTPTRPTRTSSGTWSRNRLAPRCAPRRGGSARRRRPASSASVGDEHDRRALDRHGDVALRLASAARAPAERREQQRAGTWRRHAGVAAGSDARAWPRAGKRTASARAPALAQRSSAGERERHQQQREQQQRGLRSSSQGPPELAQPAPLGPQRTCATRRPPQIARDHLAPLAPRRGEALAHALGATCRPRRARPSRGRRAARWPTAGSSRLARVGDLDGEHAWRAPGGAAGAPSRPGRGSPRRRRRGPAAGHAADAVQRVGQRVGVAVPSAATPSVERRRSAERRRGLTRAAARSGGAAGAEATTARGGRRAAGPADRRRARRPRRRRTSAARPSRTPSRGRRRARARW